MLMRVAAIGFLTESLLPFPSLQVAVGYCLPVWMLTCMMTASTGYRSTLHVLTYLPNFRMCQTWLQIPRGRSRNQWFKLKRHRTRYLGSFKVPDPQILLLWWHETTTPRHALLHSLLPRYIRDYSCSTLNLPLHIFCHMPSVSHISR